MYENDISHHPTISLYCHIHEVIEQQVCLVLKRYLVVAKRQVVIE